MCQNIAKKGGDDREDVSISCGGVLAVRAGSAVGSSCRKSASAGPIRNGRRIKTRERFGIERRRQSDGSIGSRDAGVASGGAAIAGHSGEASAG